MGTRRSIKGWLVEFELHLIDRPVVDYRQKRLAHKEMAPIARDG